MPVNTSLSAAMPMTGMSWLWSKNGRWKGDALRSHTGRYREIWRRAVHSFQRSQQLPLGRTAIDCC